MDLNAKMQKARESGYSDAEIKAYIGRSTPNPTRSAPKVGGVKGMLLNFLPTIASGAGAVIGGAAGSLLPGAGTVAGGVAGGALGGGVGEYLRQRLSGEAQDGIDKGNIVQESAFGALPGILKGAKSLRAGAKTADVIADATKAGKAVQSTEEALLARKSLLGKVADKADDIRSAVSNTQTGTIIERGRRVTPQIEKNVTTYLDKTLGASGSPKEKLIKVIADKEEVGQTIGNLAKADKSPLMIEDLQRITGKIKPGLIKNAPETELTKATRDAIASSQTKGELHTIKGQLDDELKNFYKKVDSGTATKAEEKILKSYRDGIKEVLGDIPGYKEANSQYTTILDAEKLLLKAPKPKNITVFGVDTGMGGKSIQRGKDTIGKIAQKVASSQPPVSPTSGIMPFVKSTAKASIPQAGVRAAGTAFGMPFVGSPTDSTDQIPQDMNFQEDIITDVPQETQGGVFSDPAKVEQAYFEALQSGNTKTADAILKGYEIFGKTGGSGKPESAESKKTTSNALAGLEAIASLKNTIATDPGALKKTAIPGRGLFSGAVGNALGTASIDSSRQQIVDVIARLRTGAAISKTEEERFNRFIPQAFDSPEVQAEKLGYLERQFARVAQRSGGAGTDLEGAVGL